MSATDRSLQFAPPVAPRLSPPVAAGVAVVAPDEVDVDAGMPAALRVRRLSKRGRGGRVALDDVSSEVARGECLAIAGVSGAGKSTLLRCLLDFVRPVSGGATIFGVDAREPREALGRRMRDHSKGMTRQLGLAATLLQDKPMQVLDEPMSGLDPIARS